MIRVFYGDDRVSANKEIKKLLTSDYESIEGTDLTVNDLPNIFQGISLFLKSRNILIRDFCSNKSVFSELPKYISTSHNIILLESKLDKRSTTYKDLKDKLEFREFKLPEDTNFSVVFDIFRTAKKDKVKAIKLLNQIKPTEDPIKFTGLLISQAIKDFNNHQGTKERQILKDLANLDLKQKTTGLDPWLLIEAFLVKLS